MSKLLTHISVFVMRFRKTKQKTFLSEMNNHMTGLICTHGAGTGSVMVMSCVNSLLCNNKGVCFKHCMIILTPAVLTVV